MKFRVPMACQFIGNLSFFPKLDFSLGFRHADGAFDDLANSESNHDTYGESVVLMSGMLKPPTN